MKAGMRNKIHQFSDQQIKAKVFEIVKDNAFVSEALTGDENLFKDLQFDSLAYAALVVELEEELGFILSKEDIEKNLDTPNKLVDFILRNK